MTGYCGDRWTAAVQLYRWTAGQVVSVGVLGRTTNGCPGKNDSAEVEMKAADVWILMMFCQDRACHVGGGWARDWSEYFSLTAGGPVGVADNPRFHRTRVSK